MRDPEMYRQAVERIGEVRDYLADNGHQSRAHQLMSALMDLK